MEQISLQALIRKENFALLTLLGRAAEDFGVQAYLIGGVVRDILLGREEQDIDIMVIQDAGGFAYFLRERWEDYFEGREKPKKPVVFKHYGTAKLLFSTSVTPGVSCLDFATARRETYTHPGAKPVVAQGTLREDLERRDFSVNALAVEISSSQFGVLHDYFLGREDLKKRELNILHENSFEDDPARLIRAVRFMVRFGFKLGEETKKLFEIGVREDFLRYLPKERLENELQKAREEKQGEEILERLQALGFDTHCSV